MGRPTRKQKEAEYNEKYQDIPRNFVERLDWMYDKYNISDAKANEILQKRDDMLRSLFYTQLHIILYEEPEGSPRPRARLINRNNLVEQAISNKGFIHIYSPVGKEDNMYMRRLVDDQEIYGLNNILCTPCIVDYQAYLKTPSYFSKTDIFLSEIGLIRPPQKPDWDNIGKKYSDMFNHNVWIDDALTIDGRVRKYYSILPRVEIDLSYLNMLYNSHQYRQMTKRKDIDLNNLQYYMGVPTYGK